LVERIFRIFSLPCGRHEFGGIRIIKPRGFVIKRSITYHLRPKNKHNTAGEPTTYRATKEQSNKGTEQQRNRATKEQSNKGTEQQRNRASIPEPLKYP
jgi:hypothetical protein